jgi:hypothetical protein
VVFYGLFRDTQPFGNLFVWKLFVAAQEKNFPAADRQLMDELMDEILKLF